MLESLDAEVALGFERVLTRLSKAGARLIDLVFEELLEFPALTAKGGIVAAEAIAHHRGLMAQRGAEYDPRVRMRLEAAGGISAADYLSILKRRGEIILRFNGLMAGFDAVVLPTVMNIPPPIAALGSDQDYLRFNSMSLRNTYGGNFLDCCALSIPVNEPGAVPVGLMLMAPMGRTRPCLRRPGSGETAPVRVCCISAGRPWVLTLRVQANTTCNWNKIRT